MIQSTELRIGNYCLEDGKMYQVTLADFYNMHKDDGANRLQPIPLTEEILLRCGAENLINSATGRTSFDIGSLMFENEEGGFCVFGSEWTIGKPFYYLHQLQNLYFSLTGNELQVNL